VVHTQANVHSFVHRIVGEEDYEPYAQHSNNGVNSRTCQLVPRTTEYRWAASLFSPPTASPCNDSQHSTA
jgi:hypothetical protein